ncbi:MAG: Ig-like domain-containing protein, partial [Bacteroidota bacterium]
MKKLLYVLLFNSIVFNLWSQPLSINTCPELEKRNNGNGQYGEAAGIFSGYGQNNPVAANVVGTPYQNVSFDPQTKTGFFNFKWSSATPVTNLPVITRVYLTPNGSTTAVLSSIVFGPPPPPVISGQSYFVNYSFYVSNMPPSGRVTLEFTDPQTGIPQFSCTYDLQSGSTAAAPNIGCSPTITTQPTNISVCGSPAASFSVSASGVSSYQWQVSTNGSTYSNLSNGGDYSNVTTQTLNIANPTNYDGRFYRCVLTGASGCGTTTSNPAILTAKNRPTASFLGSTGLCGTGSRSLGVQFTGTAPYSFTYTVNGGSPITVSNILASPYYFTVAPTSATTYLITSVSDANCVNTSLSGNTTLSINTIPTVTPTNAMVCNGSSSFNLSYSSTNSPNQYSITAGVRALPNFVTVTNATLTGSPISVNIPSNTPNGVYDFNLSVRNSVTGCVSSVVPFTLTVNALPSVSASAVNYSVCSGSSTTLSANGASTYSWSPSSGLLSTTGSSVTATPTTSTTYTVIGTSSSGCTNSATVSITLNTPPTLSISPSATTIQLGDAVSLTASGASSYSWSGPSSYSATGSTIVVSPSSNSTYTVTGTSANGCTGTASQMITVTGGLTLSVNHSPSSTICSGGTDTLTASGAASYTWSPVTGLFIDAAATTPYTVGTNASKVYARPSATTTYTLTGVSGNISSTTTTTVTVNAGPVTSVSPSLVAYCGGDFTGSGSISLSISATPNQTFKWERATTLTGTRTEVTSTNSGQQYSRSEAATTATGTSTLTIRTPASGDQFFFASLTSAGCTYNYPINIYNVASVNPVIGSTQTICSGNSPAAITYNGTATGGTSSRTYTYAWESSANGTLFSSTTGSSTSLSPGALSADTWYRMRLTSTSTNCPGPYFSNSVKITIGASLANNTLSIANSCVANTTITGSTPTGGTGSFVYTWERSTTSSSSGFTAVAGATGASYTPPVPAVTTWYRRVVSSGTCSNNTSNVIVVYPPITGADISSSQTICVGGSLSALATSPSGGDNSGSFTYQWQTSPNNSIWTDSSGRTTSSLTPPVVTGVRYYRVNISRGACSVTSNTSTITVNALPNVTVSPSSQNICSGNQVSITASGALTYSWSPSTALSSTSGSTVVSTASSSQVYTVTGTDANGCSNSATSNINVTTSPSAPVLSASSVVTCATSYNLSSIVSSGVNTQWFTVPEANVSYAVNAPTAVTTSGNYYAFSLDNGCYSSSNATLSLTLTDVSTPVVSSTSLSACSPLTVDLTSLQPLLNAGTTFEWHTVPSSPTPATLLATPATAGAGTYYLYRYSTAGLCYGTASSAVTVTVHSLPVSSVSSTSANVCSPSTVDLTLLNNTNNNSNTYSWHTVSSNPSAVNLVSIPSALNASGTYYLYATSTAGCVGLASSGVIVNVSTPPTANISNPNSVCAGAAVSIVGTSNATSSIYTWQVSTNAGSTYSTISTNGGIYSGVTTSTLNITNSLGTGGYQYRYSVQSSNGCSTTSNPVIIAEEALPTITIQPVGVSSFSGSSAQFFVDISGTPTASFQWQISSSLNGTYTNITPSTVYAGVNTNVLVINNTSGLNGNFYRCVISNSCGTVTSSAASLTVTICQPSPLPSFTSQPGANACGNTSITYSTQSGMTNYMWDIQGVQDVDYTIVSGGGVSDNDLILKWLTSGNKTVTINYTSSGCTAANPTASTATAVSVISNNNLSGGNQTICSGSTPLGLTGSTPSGASGAFTYTWISSTQSATSGFSLIPAATGIDYSPGALSATTWIRRVVASGSCVDSSSASVINVNAIPTISGVTDNSRCSTGTVTLNAAASAGTINWYAASTGGTTLGTGTSFTTPSITATTTYYVDATANGCTTATRSAVTATVNAIPTISGVTDNSRCGTGTVTLNAAASAGTINWYAASTGGTTLGTGTSFTTPSINTTTTYYVDATANGCTTATRSAVTATVNPLPSIITQPVTVRAITGNAVLFSVTSSNVATTQWQQSVGTASFANLLNAGIYSGVNTDTLRISNTTGLYNTRYRVLLSNACLGIITDTVNLFLNDKPVAQNDTFNIGQGGTDSIFVLLNDTDADGSINNPVVISGPNHGTITISPTGKVVYTPSGGFYGLDTIKYVICDNGNPVACDTGYVFIRINGKPDAVDDYVNINEDSTTIISTLTNDSDPDGTIGNPVILIQPKNGSATVQSNGTISYTPNNNYFGLDSIFYRICDNGTPVLCDSAWVRININPINDGPNAMDDTASVNEDDSVTINVRLNDTDIDGTLNNPSIRTTPSNGSVVVNTDGTIKYIPNPN